MNQENKIKMAKRILSDFPNKIGEVEVHITKEEQETPAQFQEYCTQIALKEYWEIKENGSNLDKENELVENMLQC